MAPLIAVHRVGFAWTSLGPDRSVHWIAPMIPPELIAKVNVGLLNLEACNMLIKHHVVCDLPDNY